MPFLPTFQFQMKSKLLTKIFQKKYAYDTRLLLLGMKVPQSYQLKQLKLGLPGRYSIQCPLLPPSTPKTLDTVPETNIRRFYKVERRRQTRWGPQAWRNGPTVRPLGFPFASYIGLATEDTGQPQTPVDAGTDRQTKPATARSLLTKNQKTISLTKETNCIR